MVRFWLLLTTLLLAACSPPPRWVTNDSTTARQELGRRLFYDVRLSGSGQIACTTCHQQALGFSDGNAVSRNANGEPLRRNAPGLFNAGALHTLTWANPTLSSLEQQAEHPLFATDPPEMGASGHAAAILQRLRADPHYPALFAAAFPQQPDPLDWVNIRIALAAFVRSLEARNTAFDRFATQGDTAALDLAARRGMALFFAPGLACGHCHTDIVPPGRGAPRWADLSYVATGVGTSPDRGLAEQTGNPADAYRFRVPPLRNVAVTAPYMHDGSLPTLDAVLRFYESGGRVGAGTEPERIAARHQLIAGFALSDADRRDLIAFLESLTDTSALHDPRFAAP